VVILALGLGSLLMPVSGSLLESGSVVSLRVTDRDGRLLRENRPDGRSTPVSLDQVPARAVEALIATEDKRFLMHPGVDPIAVVRAAWINLQAGRIVSGASTITMQVASALRESSHHGWLDKLAEMHLAVRLEVWLSKEKILETWLNRVDFGNQTHGIEAASRLYFGKGSQDLSLAQASFLIGLPQSPTRYDPLRHPERAFVRYRHVLESLERTGKIAPDERQRMETVPLDFQSPRSLFLAPHFVQWVAAGSTAGSQEMRTTLDFTLQQLVEREVAGHLRLLDDASASSAAVIVLDNATGNVMAYVGSADFFNDRIAGQNDGVRMLRQPGSALKPFTYAMALASRRYTPSSILPDIELNVLEAGGAFTPENYDEQYHGPVPLRQALASSYNVPAVRLAREFSPQRLLQQLHSAGFSSLNRPANVYGVGLTLGNGEVQLMELARAYAGLARGGTLPDIRPIAWIRTAEGDTLTAPVGMGTQMDISPQVAYLISDILSDPEARAPGFGRGGPLELPFPTAVKTGTSKDYRDNWAVGYTPRHTVAVWVGNFDGTPMRWVSGVSGAGPILNAVFRRLGSSGPFARPAGIVEAEIAPESGLLPGRDSSSRVPSLFLAGTIPRDTSNVLQRISIDVRTGLRADPSTPKEFVDDRLFRIYPPEFHAWMRQEGIPFPPQLELDYSVIDTGSIRLTDALRIDYPESGTTFQLDPVLRAEFQRIRMRATIPDGLAQASWWVDGKRVEGRFEDASWPLEAGTHLIQIRGVTLGGEQLASRPSAILVRGYETTPLQPTTP